MAGSNDLFLLIKSLEKTEKAYVKKYAFKKNTSKNESYLKLFDAFDKLEEANDDKLIKKFEGTAIANFFSASKNYLYQIILDCLRDFTSGKSVDSQLFNLYRDTRTLLKKGLLDQCEKKIKKGEELAELHEKYPIYALFSDLKMSVWKTRNDSEKLEKFLRSEIEKTSGFLALAQESLKYDLLDTEWGRIKQLKSYRDQNVVLAMDELIQELELDINKIPTAKAFIGYHSSIGSSFSQLNKWEEALTYFEKVSAKIEESPKRFSAETWVRSYIGATFNCMISNLFLRRPAGVETNIQKLLGLPEKYQVAKTPRIKAMVYERGFTGQLLLWQMTGELEHLIEEEDRMNSILDSLGGAVSPLRRMEFEFYKGVVYFALENYEKAIEHFNICIDKFDSKLRLDLQCYARIMNLFCHLELDNRELLEHILKSTERYLVSRAVIYQMEKIIIKFIRRCYGLLDKKELLQVANDILGECYELEKDDFEKNVFIYFDFIAYFESKVNGKSLRQNIKERIGLLRKKDHL